VVGALVGIAAAAQTTRPNVLLITADDMNYDTPASRAAKSPTSRRISDKARR
jgi:arylsulfatase A-like enzyme